MNSRLLCLATVLAATSTLAACGAFHGDTKPAEINPTDMPKGPGLLSGESGNLLDAFNKKGKGGESGGTIGVNIYLWRAALESVAFMPITQADSNGGVIVTDWYSSPAAPNERVRANVLILGKSLSSNAVKVTLFKQTRSGSSWANAEVSPATARALEDTILTKARALKVQTMADK
ncbi:MAG: DUF3576 domain-containing protein [Proteobacteria bacterium]|nr:DUF3576 domain-containing protein [Pseudomonadota bacterium]